MVNGAKVSRELFIFNILGVYVSLVCSYFNVEEIYGVKYGFEISSEPVLLKENSDLGNTLLLSSKHGQQYQCVLPQLESSDKKNEEAQHITKDEIPLLLEGMKKKCLYNNKGWWTYEVCFGQGIYQYHKEANDIVGDKISLGVFSNETDWSQAKIDLKEKPKPGKSSVVKRYHSQYYVNGSDCDLTGKAREAQIKIYCDEGISDVILRVDEPSSCSYVITVHTSKLCQHNLFKPSPTQKPQAITCSPALSEERYKIYVEKIELKKKAKEQAEAAKIKAQKERAAKKSKSEYGFEYDEEAERKRRSRRSPVWPWESPGVEYEDEMFIDGKIEEDKIDVHRLDITKGRKKTAEGYHEEEGITVMSQKMHRNREPEDKRQKGENDETAKEISEKRDASKETDETEKEDDGDKNKDATEQTGEQESKIKKATSEDSVEEKDIESSETENDGSRKKKEKEASKADKELDDEWKKKMDEAILKLRSSLKEKLVKLGIKPEVLDQKFGEKLGSVGGDKDDSPAGKDESPAGKSQSPTEKDESSAGKDESPAAKDESPAGKDESPAAKDESPAEKDESLAVTDEVKAGKLKEETVEGQGVEKPAKTSQKDEFTRTIDEIRKILKGDMIKEIMEAASATQAEMERQFDEERAKMKSDVELIKNKIKEMEETEEYEQFGETMSRVKESIERFEKTNMELDEDMQVLKELNDELLRIMEDKDNTETRGDLLQLSADSNKVLKKILLRRFQLEQDLRYIKRTGSKLSGSEERGENTENVGLGTTTKGGIDQVINKLKNMIQDLDNPEAGIGTGEGSDDTPGVKPGSSGTTAGVEDEELASESDGLDEGDLGSGVRVKVHKIKKINIPEDEEAELEETDLDEEEMEELNIDKRIRKATKKMEEMVKQQLRDSGVLPAGRIRVKIVTSKDALESLDEKSEGKLLSEKEETQFKDMILSLLGGSPEAGKERRRQEDLQNNYNLVWDDDDLQTVPREDDEADGEVEVVSY